MKKTTRTLICGALVSSFAGAQQAKSLQDGPVVIGHTHRLATMPFNDELVKRLKVPAGFAVSIWAQNVGHPRMIAVGDDGTVFVTRYQEGDVLAFKDHGSAGGEQIQTATKLDKVHGIVLKDKKVWLTNVHDLYTADLNPDSTFTQPKKLIDSLGDGGQHDKRTLGIGPDGMLYISVGSTCNACYDPRDERAAIFRAKLDGTGREIYARGLRNTIGFDWHPETKELWGMDNGVDWEGDERPKEKLNKIVQNGDYGWPFCIENKEPDQTYENDPKDSTKEEFCKRTIGPELMYPAHSAPIAFVFYKASMFPEDFKGDAFAAFHGSWNRRVPSGYEVVRVKFDHGKAVRMEPFLTGFVVKNFTAQFGRPAGVAVAKDGALLVSDDSNGVIYRVAYTGRSATKPQR